MCTRSYSSCRRLSTRTNIHTRIPVLMHTPILITPISITAILLIRTIFTLGFPLTPLFSCYLGIRQAEVIGIPQAPFTFPAASQQHPLYQSLLAISS